MLIGKLLNQKLLNEKVSSKKVCDAIDNKSRVIINYRSNGEGVHTGSRLIEPFAYGQTKSGHDVIRAFQQAGDTTHETIGWKLFRLDRITYWEETPTKFYTTPSEKYGKYNENGDNSLAFVSKSVSFTSGKPNDYRSGGPKTKDKIYARTSGDEELSNGVGARNIANMKNGGVKIDIEGNKASKTYKKKVGDHYKKFTNSFNIYTDNTPKTSGPKNGDKSYQPISIEGDDISNETLSALRDKAVELDTQRPKRFRSITSYQQQNGGLGKELTPDQRQKEMDLAYSVQQYMDDKTTQMPSVDDYLSGKLDTDFSNYSYNTTTDDNLQKQIDKDLKKMNKKKKGGESWIEKADNGKLFENIDYDDWFLV